MLLLQQISFYFPEWRVPRRVPCSWVDVDTRGSVPPIAGQPTPNTIWYRIPATPSAADVNRMTVDVAVAFREAAVCSRSSVRVG